MPRPGTSPFDHFVYVIAGDGDLQEGVTSEASSLAGHQQLGNLVVIYDSNQISIEDDTNIAFTEDVAKRYEAYGWHVQVVDWKKTGEYVEDVAELHAAIEAAKGETDKPSIIILKTIIGWPSPRKQNTGKIHGSALGADELAATKEVLGFDPEQTFVVADEVLEHTRKAVERGAAAARRVAGARSTRGPRPTPRRRRCSTASRGRRAARRASRRRCPSSRPARRSRPAPRPARSSTPSPACIPELWGGSADLAESNLTTINGAASFIPTEWSTHEWPGNPYGRVLHFGIREHAMGAIVNGIVLHGNTRAFGGTFLIFSDYMRPAVRLAALMKAPSIFVWTHDSVALGEDGPTHQPIEQLATLRAIPGLDGRAPRRRERGRLRLADDPQAPRRPRRHRAHPPEHPRVRARRRRRHPATPSPRPTNVAKGAYVLAEAPNGTPDVILIATGSEVQLAVEAREELEAEGINARVVSAPSLEWFEEQDAEYRESVLPAAVTARVSVEAGIALTLAPLRRRRRPQRVDRALRRLRRLQDPVPRVRHHHRGRRRRRQGIARVGLTRARRGDTAP